LYKAGVAALFVGDLFFDHFLRFSSSTWRAYYNTRSCFAECQVRPVIRFKCATSKRIVAIHRAGTSWKRGPVKCDEELANTYAVHVLDLAAQLSARMAFIIMSDLCRCSGCLLKKKKNRICCSPVASLSVRLGDAFHPRCYYHSVDAGQRNARQGNNAQYVPDDLFFSYTWAVQRTAPPNVRINRVPIWRIFSSR